MSGPCCGKRWASQEWELVIMAMEAAAVAREPAQERVSDYMKSTEDNRIGRRRKESTKWSDRGPRNLRMSQRHKGFTVLELLLLYMRRYESEGRKLNVANMEAALGKMGEKYTLNIPLPKRKIRNRKVFARETRQQRLQDLRDGGFSKVDLHQKGLFRVDTNSNLSGEINGFSSKSIIRHVNKAVLFEISTRKVCQRIM
jgi:hypothetical protein